MNKEEKLIEIRKIIHDEVTGKKVYSKHCRPGWSMDWIKLLGVPKAAKEIMELMEK